MSERLLTVEEAADHLRLTSETIRRYLRRGILRGIKTGNNWKVPNEAIREFEARGGTNPTEPVTE